MSVPIDPVLCTETAVRNLIRVNAGFTRYDEVISMCIRVASSQVLKYVGKDLVYGERVEYLAPPRAGAPSIIRLAGENIDYAQPIELYYDALADFNGNESELVLNTDFKLMPSTNQVRLLSYYDYAPRALKVVYYAGYDNAADPPNLLQTPAKYADATAIQAAFLYERLASGSLGKLSEEKEGTSRTVWTKAAQEGLIGEARGMLAGSTRQPYVGKY